MDREQIEILAPAGDLEKLKLAITYGADAVYLGGERFGLRAAAKNFSIEQIKEGADFAHSKGKRLYVTVNLIPHNEDFEGLEEYLKELQQSGVDALIASDPGVIMKIKEAVPGMEIHLSTQANNTNYMSARFWHSQGIKRVVVARELSVGEIGEIRANIPDDMEIEAFVHGAMCISYSGRCLISNYMTGKDANKGECKHPCRWKYSLMEETRPGEYYPIYEDERGTFFFNSKDLCLIEHIPELVQAGIKSFKIEGRMKSAYYVATIVRAYRMAIDEYLKNPQGWKFKQEWLEELEKVSHRGFTKGFYFNKPGHEEHHYGSSSYVRNYDFIGLVQSRDDENGEIVVQQRNRFFLGDEIEIIGPGGVQHLARITGMRDEAGNGIEVAPRPKETIRVKLDIELDGIGENFILRKKAEQANC